MAVEGGVEKSLEELEKEVTCPICRDHFTDPRILPCCHLFCKGCILRVVLVYGLDKPFQCPVCRSNTLLPDANMDNLKKAFYINTLKAIYASMVGNEQQGPKAQIQCELCSSRAKAEGFCSRCAAFICNECTDLHRRVKTFDGHKVLTLKELIQKGIQEVVERDPEIDHCQQHSEKLTKYCHSCICLVCEKCISDGHQSHAIDVCSVAAPVSKRALVDSLGPLREKELEYVQGMEEAQQALDAVQEHGVGVANTIEASFRELHRILDERKAQLLEEASDVVQRKASELTARKERMTNASAEISGIVYYSEQCTRHCTDSEFMTIHPWVKGQVEQGLQKHKKASDTGALDRLDMGVSVNCCEYLRQLCLARAKLTGQHAQQNFFVPSKVMLGQQSVAWVDLRTVEGEEGEKQVTVDSSFRTVHSKVVTTCKIEKDELGKRYIFFTPMVRGRHELSISLEDHDIQGSPFSVEVSAHPSQLSRAFSIYSNVTEPTAIAIDSMQQIIVGERSGRLIQFDNSGSLLWTLGHSKHFLGQIYGIAVDKKDNIYCTDYRSNRILVCNSKGEDETVHIVATEVGVGRRGVAVVGEKLMTIERDSFGTVMVYNLKFTLLRRIQGNNMGLLQYIACDNYLNVYVTDKGTSSIHVFRSDGEYLRSFGSEPSVRRNKLLKEPYSLCVADNYVYVVDFSQHKVVAFTTDGEYVRSLDKSTSGLRYPRGVCADKDGFLYISDDGSNDVRKF